MGCAVQKSPFLTLFFVPLEKSEVYFLLGAAPRFRDLGITPQLCLGDDAEEFASTGLEERL